MSAGSQFLGALRRVPYAGLRRAILGTDAVDAHDVAARLYGPSFEAGKAIR